MIDFNQILAETNDILSKLENLDASEWQKKKDLIESYVIKNRYLLEHGKLELANKKDFSSYISAKLLERNITVNRNGNFYALFNDDEKDPRGPKSIDQKSIEISSVSEEFANRKVQKERIKNKITEFLGNMRECVGIASRLIDAVEEKYNEGFKKEIDDYYYEKLPELTAKWVSIHATLTLARNEIDDRQKYGDYEKIIAQHLIEIGETTANLARKLGYCSKYGSIGIQRNDDIIEYRDYIRKCPACKTDIAHEFNLEIQRYKSGKKLKYDDPIKGN